MKNFPNTWLNSLNNMDLTKERNIAIGGYSLPADFTLITPSMLSSLQDLSYEERIQTLYKCLSGNELPENAFSNLSNVNFPASVVSIDQGLSVLELFDGINANYTDYLVKGSLLSEVVSLASTFISAYVDLVSGGVIVQGEKINLSINGEDGIVLLSAWLCKRVGLPINVILVGVNKPVQETVKDLYFEAPIEGDLTTLISGLYEEVDYLLDPLSTYGLVSYDLYYSDYEDDSVTLLVCLASPYLYARQVLKHAFNVNEISVDKAITKLNILTGIEIPQGILDKTIQPFFKINSQISVKDAIEIIKSNNKI